MTEQEFEKDVLQNPARLRSFLHMLFERFARPAPCWN